MSMYMDRNVDLGKFIPGPDDDLIVCRCEEITKGQIRKAVYEGMLTMTEIRRYLRVGMGLCQGNTCGRIVKGIIADELSMRSANLAECTARGPARPIEIKVFGNEVENNE